MGKAYGYVRISRKDQNIERQIRNIKAEYPAAVIVAEAYTGAKTTGRTRFKRLLKTVKTGDTIIFDSVSRMSRNAAEGFALYEELFSKGVELVFLKEHYIDTATYKKAWEGGIALTGEAKVDPILKGVNEVLLTLKKEQIALAFEQAQKEVDDLRQRTKEGIETARLNGKQIGQIAGRKLNVKKAAAAKEIIRKHSKDFLGTLSDVEVMKLANVARNTYYKYKRELAEELREGEEVIFLKN